MFIKHILKSVLRLSIVLILFSGFSGCQAQDKEIIDPVRYWDLPSGSHIAYIRFLSEDSSNSVPLFFFARRARRLPGVFCGNWPQMV